MRDDGGEDDQEPISLGGAIAVFLLMLLAWCVAAPPVFFDEDPLDSMSDPTRG